MHYQTPEMEIFVFGTEDIVTASINPDPDETPAL